MVQACRCMFSLCLIYYSCLVCVYVQLLLHFQCDNWRPLPMRLESTSGISFTPRTLARLKSMGTPEEYVARKGFHVCILLVLFVLSWYGDSACILVSILVPCARIYLRPRQFRIPPTIMFRHMFMLSRILPPGHQYVLLV